MMLTLKAEDNMSERLFFSITLKFEISEEDEVNKVIFNSVG